MNIILKSYIPNAKLTALGARGGSIYWGYYIDTHVI